MSNQGCHDAYGGGAGPDAIPELLQEFKRRGMVPDEIATEIKVDINRGEPERALRRITQKRRELRDRGELDDDQDD